MTCAFCEDLKVKERTIVENDLAFAFLTYTPIVPGHTLVSPKRHVKNYDSLTSDERQAIEDLRSGVRLALIKSFGAQGFNYAWNEEQIAGQSLPHFHLHIVPRKEGDAGIYEYEPRKFLYRPDSRAEDPQEELLAVSTLIRDNLSQ